MSEFIDQYKDNAYIYLVEQIREKLCDELKAMIDGDAANTKSLVDAKKFAAAMRPPEKQLLDKIPDVEGLQTRS